MKTRIQMLLFILLLGGIFTTALVVVNDFTAPLIEKNQVLKKKTGVLKALQIEFTKDNIEDVFDNKVTIKQKDNETYYVTSDGIMAFDYSGPGLWGQIKGIVALEPDLKTIYGIAITFQEETPGLGSRIAESSYLNGFKGKVFDPLLELIPAGKENKPNGIDVITGATISTDKFLILLNEKNKSINKIMKGGE